jgi:hypothetical protein
MKIATIAGILLLIVGVLGFVYQGIGYTRRENVLNVGPVNITQESHQTIPISPVLAGLALAGGVALLAVGKKS